MTSSMSFFLIALCFTAATASPLAARGYPPTVTPSIPVPPSHTPSIPVPPSHPPSIPVPPSHPPSTPVPPSHTPTVPVPPVTTSCPPTVTVPAVPPCTKDCPPTTPPVTPPCTKDCPTTPPVTPPCTKDCPPTSPPSSGCHPNFAGAALTLSTAGGALSWSANPVVGNPLSASPSPSRFFFQQNGFSVVSYTVKTVDNVNFALEAKSGAPLIATIDPSGSNPNQKWFVDCSSCSSADISQTKGKVATGCRISTGTDTNKQCITSKGPGPMTLAGCDGSGPQLFDFTAV